MSGNVLGLEVYAEHVAEAYIALAKSERKKDHTTTVDGGNIAASLEWL